MSTLRVTAVQYAPGPSAAENLRAMSPLVELAEAVGSELVVFPEYSHAFSPGLGDQWASHAETTTGAFVEGLIQLSRRHGGIVIIAGMLLRFDEDPRPANTQIAVGPEGILARAEKIHLYDAFGATESTWIRPGTRENPELFTCGGMTIGMMACYDLRFPEVARRLVDAGAEVIVTPAQWVPGENKAHHFETLLVARAIETQTFVVASGHPEPEGVGLSQIVDPRGVVLARAGVTPEVLHVSLESALLEEVREANPMKQARRFGVIALPE
jgi:deaminated glutathione amidase